MNSKNFAIFVPETTCADNDACDASRMNDGNYKLTLDETYYKATESLFRVNRLRQSYFSKAQTN